jgi:hypothetical protein
VIKALAVVAFFAVSPQAIAACLSHNPIDPACRNYDFLSDSFANVDAYVHDKPGREAMLAMCAHPYGRPPPAKWCTAAAQAAYIATGRR